MVRMQTLEEAKETILKEETGARRAFDPRQPQSTPEQLKGFNVNCNVKPNKSKNNAKSTLVTTTSLKGSLCRCLWSDGNLAPWKEMQFVDAV